MFYQHSAEREYINFISCAAKEMRCVGVSLAPEELLKFLSQEHTLTARNDKKKSRRSSDFWVFGVRKKKRKREEKGDACNVKVILTEQKKKKTRTRVSCPNTILNSIPIE